MAEAPGGQLSGIWLSTYDYYSSGRDKTYRSQHYVVILQTGAALQVRSLPGTAQGRVTMDLAVKDRMVTGTWEEQTDEGGYYAGARYFGAIQMTLTATNDRMAGQWAGFNKEYNVQTGPWTLRLVTSDLSRESLASYDRPVPPEDEPAG
jgi:hypothetical protein